MELWEAQSNSITSFNKVNSLRGAHGLLLLFPLFRYLCYFQINFFIEYMHLSQVEQLAHCLASYVCS